MLPDENTETANQAGNAPESGTGQTPNPDPGNSDPNAGGGGGGDGGAGDGAPSRPEGLPEQYWDETAGLKVEDLVGDFTKAQTELEALRGEKAEWDIRAGGVPETPEGYTATLPEGLEVPEGMTVEIDENDPLLGAARTAAHAAGITQEQFQGIVGAYVQNRVEELKALKGLSDAERSKLGEKAQDRIDNVKRALKSRVGEEGLNELMSMAVTARQVEFLERLIRHSGAPQPTNGAGAVQGVPGWEKMSPTQKFAEWHQRQAPPARR